MNVLDKAFKECDKCIVFSANDGFAPCLAVMIQSIIENSSDDSCYDMIVLHKDISEENRKRITSQASGRTNVSIRFCDIGEYAGDTVFFTENRKTITEETYFRLFLPWILSDEYRYAVYLDGDMICRKDIGRIFDIELSDKLIAAVKDYWGICNCYMEGEDIGDYRRSIGLTDIDSYIIAGTIIFNLAEFRKEYSLQEVIELATSNNWRQHDQDVVNILCKGRIKYIDASWGWISDYGNNQYLPEYLFNELAAVTDPTVIHFAGSRKPWRKLFTECDIEFWEYASRSGFFEELFLKIKSEEYQHYILDQLGDAELVRRLDREYIRINRIRVSEDDALCIEGVAGFYHAMKDDSIEVFFDIDGSRTACDLNREDYSERDCLIRRAEAFSLEFNLKEKKKLDACLVIELNGKETDKYPIVYGDGAPFSGLFSNEYYEEKGWSIRPDGRQLKLSRCDSSDIKKLEKQFRKEIAVSAKGRKAVIYRMLGQRKRKNKKTRIEMSHEINGFSDKVRLLAADSIDIPADLQKKVNPFGNSRIYFKDMLSRVEEKVHE